MASASNRPTRKRTYRTAEVITKLDESDSELYDDSDSDRDSNYMLSDVEPVSDADSSATEVNAQPPVDSQVAMSVDDTVDTDPPSDSDDSADVTRAEWIPVSETYIPPTDILFTGNSGIVQPTDLSAASTPIELFQQFITDSVIDTFVSETNRFAEQFLHATTLQNALWTEQSTYPCGLSTVCLCPLSMSAMCHRLQSRDNARRMMGSDVVFVLGGGLLRVLHSMEFGAL